MEWKVLDSKIVIQDDPWIRVRCERCELPDGKIIERFHIMDFPNWINVLPITEDGDVILTKQYRHGIGKVMLELPSGIIDEGEEPIQAAARELLEETGHSFKEMIPLSVVNPNPSNHSNQVFSFLAIGCEKVQEQSLDTTEELESLVVSFEEFQSILDNNGFHQSLHVTCCYYGLKKLKDLGIFQ